MDNPYYEVGSVCLGYIGVVASWRRPKDGAPARHGHMLVIQTRSDTGESVFTPAECVTINGKDSIIALRDAINELLKEPAQNSGERDLPVTDRSEQT